jgi:hypothetical protein
MKPAGMVRMTIRLPDLIRDHIKNRARVLGIDPGTLIMRAVCRATDKALKRELGS